VTPDTALFLAGLASEAAIVILLLFKRVYRTLPFFFLYMSWSLLIDVVERALLHRFPTADMRIYLGGTVIDSLLQFSVLVELSISVLRPVRSALPRAAIFIVGIVVALICAAIWPFAKTPGLDQISIAGQLIVHSQLTFAALRILFFLALAGFSQLLSIGWRDRELQIATGLGFFSLVSMSVALSHTNQTPGGTQYHMLEQLVSASYICSIGYWIVSFAQKVPERREFTPQMQNFLLAMAGNARSTRIAMASSESKNDRHVRR
jgi:hypothetical protein